MDFSWTEEQLKYKEAVIEFAQNELNKELIDRDLRDTIESTLYSGTPDIQRMIIARLLDL